MLVEPHWQLTPKTKCMPLCVGGLESSELTLGIPGSEFFHCRIVQGNSLPDVIGAKQGGFLWDKIP